MKSQDENQKNNLSFCNIKNIEEVNLIDDKVLFLLSENICEEEIPQTFYKHSIKKVIDIIL